jgi:hypothetical protein
MGSTGWRSRYPDQPEGEGLFEGIHFHTHTNNYNKAEAIQLSRLLTVCLSQRLAYQADRSRNMEPTPTGRLHQAQSFSCSSSLPSLIYLSPTSMSAKWMDPNLPSKKCFNIMRLEPTLLETCCTKDESGWYRESGCRSV